MERDNDPKARQSEDGNLLSLMPHANERNEREHHDDEARTCNNLTSFLKRPGLIWALISGLTNTAHVLLLGKVAHVSNPMQSLFTRSVFLLTLVLLVSWEAGNEYKWRDLVLNILYGLCETVGSVAGITAMVLTSTADASAIVFNKAAPAAILARILLGELLDAVDGVLIIMNGIGLILICKMSIDDSESDDGSSAIGIFLAFCGLFFLSLQYSLVRFLVDRNTADPALLGFMVGCNGVVLSSIYLSVTSSWMFPETRHEVILYICLGGVSLFSFYAFLRALRTENAYIVAASITLSVPLTYCYEVIFVNRVIAWQTILGVFFTISSTLLLYIKSFLKEKYINE